MRLILFLLLPSLVWAESHMEAIQNINQEEMLGQRMLMNYALIGMGIKYQQPEVDLKRNIIEFEQTLKTFKKNEVLRMHISGIKKQWAAIKRILEAPPNKQNAIQLRNKIENLVNKLEMIAEKLAEQENLAQIINLAAHQKMLAQRMATLYALSAWRIDQFDFLSEFKRTVSLFRQTQNKLLSFANNTKEIQQYLEQVEKHFKWFEYAARSNSDRFIPSLILRASNRIIKGMDQVTHLYSHL